MDNTLSVHLTRDSSPEGRAFGKKMTFAWTAKGSHFGGAGNAGRH